MSDLLVKDFPEVLKQEIAHAAKSGGQSLSAKAVDLLRKGLQLEQEASARPRPSAWEGLRSAFAEAGFEGKFACELEEIEAQSKRDFGRPVDFGGPDDETDGVANG